MRARAASGLMLKKLQHPDHSNLHPKTGFHREKQTSPMVINFILCAGGVIGSSEPDPLVVVTTFTPVTAVLLLSLEMQEFIKRQHR